MNHFEDFAVKVKEEIISKITSYTYVDKGVQHGCLTTRRCSQSGGTK